MAASEFKPVIVALDFSHERDVEELLPQLDARACRVKIGKELFTRCGPRIVERVVGAGFEVFLDLKYHDIPNTVAGACDAAADLGCWMINVHASGGRAMLDAARERLARRREKPLLIAVTVLTSLDEAALADIGFTMTPEGLVTRLAVLAHAAGIDGVVCSAHELPSIRAACGESFVTVTPGVRPAAAAPDDQRRVATPVEAMQQGADFLVIGRPITRAAEPALALAAINADLSAFATRGA